MDLQWDELKACRWDCHLEAMSESQTGLTQWETRWGHVTEQLKGNKKDSQTVGWKESYLVPLME